MLNARTMNRQDGVFLLEALIGLLIFAIGVLGIVALQASAISAQSDAQYRIEAANMVDRMIGQISLNVDRSSATATATSLAAYAHHTTGDPGSCDYSGDASDNADVTAWVTRASSAAATRLPGTTTGMTQILVATGTFNRVTVSLCWQPTSDGPKRRHTVIAYIN